MGVLVLQSLAQMLLSLRYSSRHYPYRVSFSAKFLGRGIHVVRLGLAFVVAGLMSSGAEFLIRAYINRIGELSDVGLFNAGWTLAVVYAGLVFSAMEADYFPRLSSVKEMGVEQERLCQQAVGNQCFADGAHIDGRDFGLASLDSTFSTTIVFWMCLVWHSWRLSACFSEQFIFR